MKLAMSELSGQSAELNQGYVLQLRSSSDDDSPRYKIGAVYIFLRVHYKSSQ